jgi:glutaconate CoA-transferase, subunit A
MKTRATFLSLEDAVRLHVADGSSVALEGFTHLIPFAAGHEIIRQRKRALKIHRMTPDLIYDQIIGMGCADTLVFSWAGNPGVGSLHRLRDAVEHGWPVPLVLHEYSHAEMANAYVAGASGLPFAVLRGSPGSDHAKRGSRTKTLACPFTGETVVAVPSIRVDTTIIHAQQADRRGNVQLWGISGVQKEAALCAKKVLVTVEEIVERIEPTPGGVVLPDWVVTAVVEVPRGAAPSYAQGYYERDNGFYEAWDAIARDRNGFVAWMDRHVLATRDFGEYERLRLREASQGPGPGEGCEPQ